MAQISIALSKGRIFDETVPLLARAGIQPEGNGESRKLVIGTNRPELRLIIVRASDTPTYVQHGGADLGIAGRDVLVEHGGEGLYQPVDLGIAACRMMVAVRKGFDYERAVRQGARLRVATKYLNTTREHFAGKGVHVDLIRLYGSMELAPLVGLADLADHIEIGCRSGLQEINDVFFGPIADPVLARGDVRRGPIPFRALGAGEGVALDDAAERVARAADARADLPDVVEHEVGRERIVCGHDRLANAADTGPRPSKCGPAARPARRAAARDGIPTASP